MVSSSLRKRYRTMWARQRIARKERGWVEPRQRLPRRSNARASALAGSSSSAPAIVARARSSAPLLIWASASLSISGMLAPPASIARWYQAGGPRRVTDLHRQIANRAAPARRVDGDRLPHPRARGSRPARGGRCPSDRSVRPLRPGNRTRADRRAVYLRPAGEHARARRILVGQQQRAPEQHQHLAALIVAATAPARRRAP